MNRHYVERPTLEMLKLQCAKTGLPDDEAQHFMDYYESNGWRVGRNPMKSWRGALANWKRNFDEKRFKNQNNNQPAEHYTTRDVRRILAQTEAQLKHPEL